MAGPVTPAVIHDSDEREREQTGSYWRKVLGGIVTRGSGSVLCAWVTRKGKGRRLEAHSGSHLETVK